MPVRSCRYINSSLIEFLCTRPGGSEVPLQCRTRGTVISKSFDPPFSATIEVVEVLPRYCLASNVTLGLSNTTNPVRLISRDLFLVLAAGLRSAER